MNTDQYKETFLHTNPNDIDAEQTHEKDQQQPKGMNINLYLFYYSKPKCNIY